MCIFSVGQVAVMYNITKGFLTVKSQQLSLVLVSQTGVVKHIKEVWLVGGDVWYTVTLLPNNKSSKKN